MYAQHSCNIIFIVFREAKSIIQLLVLKSIRYPSAGRVAIYKVVDTTPQCDITNFLTFHVTCSLFHDSYFYILHSPCRLVELKMVDLEDLQELKSYALVALRN